MNEVKFKGMLVTKHPVQNGIVFSDEAISDIVINQPKVPVRVNFAGDPIGYAEYFTRKDDGLEVAFTLTSGIQDNQFLYIVPGGKYDLANVSVGEDGVRTIKKLELTELSITLHPADPTLAPFTRRNIEESRDEKSESS